MMTLHTRGSGFILAKNPERDSLLLILHTWHRIPEKTIPLLVMPYLTVKIGCFTTRGSSEI